MAKTKQGLGNFSDKGPVPSDHPIYTGGWTLLRPIRGKAQKPDSEEEYLRNDDDGDKSTED